MLVITTHNKQDLDPTLICSGRIDKDIEFKYTTLEQIDRLFQRFYREPGPPNRKNQRVEAMANAFSELVGNSGVLLTTADVQRHLLNHRNSIKDAFGQLGLRLRLSPRLRLRLRLSLRLRMKLRLRLRLRG